MRCRISLVALRKKKTAALPCALLLLPDNARRIEGIASVLAATLKKKKRGTEIERPTSSMKWRWRIDSSLHPPRYRSHRHQGDGEEAKQGPASMPELNIGEFLELSAWCLIRSKEPILQSHSQSSSTLLTNAATESSSAILISTTSGNLSPNRLSTPPQLTAEQFENPPIAI
ncbi:hypothetical protein NDU88_006940 [Pleurodeles waltl]|uniref:Uncharacterized protein n=1 Tax=Pleurodeles waltl TaxID=8319 RepID=A0AAV7NA36_PLEWA|nr:hypothetical protein NDU88_006940 [Pleurodeles waltl]